MNPNDVLTFWFDELELKDWFVKNLDLDQKIKDTFGELHSRIVLGELNAWKESPEGTLALVIVLDQFSRNMFRDSAESFKYDSLALEIAKEGVEKGYDQELTPEQRSFIYMPYMHSELKEVHEEALKLFESLGNEGNLKYEKLHKRIIDQFGRYPHRNAVLGRESTPEEIDFLENDENASF